MSETSGVEISFRVVYNPRDAGHFLHAYDAAQALYGMARSLAVTTHYAINGRVIRQAPSLQGATILVSPPREGSFEFLFLVLADPIVQGVAGGVLANYITDITKYAYRKISGLPYSPDTEALQQVLDTHPGDIDALCDSIDSDVVRVHRPIENNVNNFHIYGGHVQIGDFNRQTFDAAKFRELSRGEEVFVGRVAALNANSDHGRIWIADLGRTIAFQRDREVRRLRDSDRQMLSWSLDQYTNGENGDIALVGKCLRNRSGDVTKIFIHRVEVSR